MIILIRCSHHGIWFAGSIAARFEFRRLTVLFPFTLQYEDGEEVTFWMNKVGPYHNPQEVQSLPRH